MRRGFTLIELLVTTAIIGMLATAGTATYQYVRASARDAKRVADIRTIYNAVELYFEQHGAYPDSPPAGLVLGSENAKMISDAGITATGGEMGALYLQNVPYNVLPHGIPYVYHAKKRDGSICAEICPSYEIAFELETPTGTLAAGPHLMTDEGIMGEEAGTSGSSAFAGLTHYLPSQDQVVAAFGTAQETAALAREAADHPTVQIANKAIVVPASVLSAFASVSAAVAGILPAGAFGNFAALFFTQPLLFLARQKRRRWGVVYHAGTKAPIDLAAVRLLDAKTGRIVATKVTDKDGRFFFAPKSGEYRLSVAKPGFRFPATSLAALSDDGAYSDIYHGTLLVAESDGQVLTANVPLEPEREPLIEARELLTERNKASLRKAAAFGGPMLGAFALLVTPTLWTLLLFLMQLFAYQLFKRLAEPVKPKSQGVLYDIDTRKPVEGAVIRVLSLPYHKVLETRLTDAQGRYAFNVGAGLYYLIALKPGYEKTETDEIDFTKNTEPAWIASDLPLRKRDPKLDK